MVHLIIAPHPDDEWIGCGCMIQFMKDIGLDFKVIIVTSKTDKTKDIQFNMTRRIELSKSIAKFLDYPIDILGLELGNINQEQLKSELEKYDNVTTVYVPDEDTHSDHQVVSIVAQQVFKEKQLIQYCVYNNALNIYTRLSKLISCKPSFRLQNEFGKGYVVDYKLEEKDKILNIFWQSPKGGDVLRRLN